MAEYQKKSNSNLWHSPLVLGILFLVMLVFIYNMISIVEKARDTNKKTATINSQIKNLNEREQMLKNDISKLKTEEGVETVLRDKYQLVKNGEKMVVIVDQEASVVQAVPDKPKGSSFLDFFRNIFKRN